MIKRQKDTTGTIWASARGSNPYARKICSQCWIKLVGALGTWVLVLRGLFDEHPNILIYLFCNECVKDALFVNGNLKGSPIS